MDSHGYHCDIRHNTVTAKLKSSLSSVCEVKGGQALQIPITAQHVLCSLVPLASFCPLCPDEIREGQSLVWIHM